MKKILALLLAVLFVLSLLTACGEKKQKEAEDTEEEQEEVKESKKDKKKDRDREKDKDDTKEEAPAYNTEMEGEADTSVPAEEAAAVEEVVSAYPDTFELEITNSADYTELYSTLFAYDSDGAEMWHYEFPMCHPTELDLVQDIGPTVNGYYVVCDGILYCIDYDGSELWRNTDFRGASANYAFDDSGCIYLCGFYGPDICKINAEGDTVYRFATLPYGDGEHPDNFWPYRVSCVDNYVEITFEFSGMTVMIDAETGTPFLEYNGEIDSDPILGAWKCVSTEIEGCSYTAAETGTDCTLTFRPTGSICFEFKDGYTDVSFDGMLLLVKTGAMYIDIDYVGDFPWYSEFEHDAENSFTAAVTGDNTLELIWYRGPWTEETYPVALWMKFVRK